MSTSPVNSPQAQAARKAAVAAVACPKCGASKGFACQTAKGGYYNPRYNVHAERLQLAKETK
jgi:hypothetical protein